jgi:hypothetical protein
MGIPGARHQLVTRLVSSYPRLAARLSWTGGEGLPEHDRLQAGPTTHERPGDSPLENDVTVRAMRGGEPASFVHVEMQGRFTEGKFLSLRAYHGSEVLKTGTGGTMVVLSPDAETTAKFRAAEAARGRELAYRGVYLSGEDIAGDMAAPDRPFEERALAAAMTDYTAGIPPGTFGLLEEMLDRDPIMGDLLVEVIAKDCPLHDKRLEEEMSPEAYERLKQVTAFRPYFEKERTEGMLIGKTEGQVDGEAVALLRYFAARGDELSLHAQMEIASCADPETLIGWLDRAYRGATSADIFDSVSALSGSGAAWA